MKSWGRVLLLVSFLLNGPAGFAEMTETEQALKKPQASSVQEAGKRWWRSNLFTEYSRVGIGDRKTTWKETAAGLIHFGERFIPYFEASRHERSGEADLAYSAGVYLKEQDSLTHAEAGIGTDTDYLYDSKVLLEREQRLSGGLYWKAGAKYLSYAENDVYVVSPGLVYYIGDHSLRFDYNVSFIESRGDAHFGSLKGNFQMTPEAALWAGAAYGRRLYDIHPIEASEQEGFIVFGGFEFKFLEDIFLRIGVSYAEEKPDFRKRGVEAGVSFRF